MPDELHSRATHPVSSIGSVLRSVLEQVTGPPLVPEPALEPLAGPAVVVDAPPPTPVLAAFPAVVLAALLALPLAALPLPPGVGELVDGLQAQVMPAPRSMDKVKIGFMR